MLLAQLHADCYKTRCHTCMPCTHHIHSGLPLSLSLFLCVCVSVSECQACGTKHKSCANFCGDLWLRMPENVGVYQYICQERPTTGNPTARANEAYEGMHTHTHRCTRTRTLTRTHSTCSARMHSGQKTIHLIKV